MSPEIASPGSRRSVRTQLALLMVERCGAGYPEAVLWQGDSTNNRDAEVASIFQRAAELESAGWVWNDIKAELTPQIEKMSDRLKLERARDIDAVAAKLSETLNRIYDGGNDE